MRIFTLTCAGFVTLGSTACRSPLGRPFTSDEQALFAVQARITECERVRAEALREIERNQAWEAQLEQRIADRRKAD